VAEHLLSMRGTLASIQSIVKTNKTNRKIITYIFYFCTAYLVMVLITMILNEKKPCKLRIYLLLWVKIEDVDILQ
jgi:hypothetical protein